MMGPAGPHHRAAVVAIVVTAAIAIICAAWFAAGCYFAWTVLK